MMLANLALLAGAVVFAQATCQSVCTIKLRRQAWHTFTDDEKLSYIDAKLCLMDKEATLGLNGTRNRFEELQASHQTYSEIVHGVGAFLLYHRLFVHAHEKLLREECGYKGAYP